MDETVRRHPEGMEPPGEEHNPGMYNGDWGEGSMCGYFIGRAAEGNSDGPMARIRCDRRGWTDEDMVELVDALGGPSYVENQGKSLVQKSLDPPVWFQLDLASQELFWGFVKGLGMWAGYQVLERFRDLFSTKAEEVSERVGFRAHKVDINGVYEGVEVQLQFGGTPEAVAEALESMEQAADVIENVVDGAPPGSLSAVALNYRGPEEGWIVNFHYDEDGKVHRGAPQTGDE